MFVAFDDLMVRMSVCFSGSGRIPMFGPRSKKKTAKSLKSIVNWACIHWKVDSHKSILYTPQLNKVSPYLTC